MRVWIDLTNSPHVLVMRPVIRALERRGADVLVTARDFAQTVGLCERFGIEHEVIGRHRGGRLAAKGIGLLSRSTALARWARGREIDIALGHGSNDVTVAARLHRIPSTTASSTGTAICWPLMLTTPSGVPNEIVEMATP